MDEPGIFKIKITPVVKKPQRRKLPARVDRAYPQGLPAIFISGEVLQSLRAFASSDLDYELGGVLVGISGKATRRTFVEIKGFVPARKGISRRASFEFTNEAQQEIHEIMQDRFPRMEIVGWFHTHPGYGIFLSHADQFIDQNFFNQKHHIAVVLDPCRPEIEVGAFVWKQRERLRVPFFEI